MVGDYYLYHFDDCIFNKKILLRGGEIRIIKNGVTLLTGKNGTGKSTLLKRIYKSYFKNGVYIAQENDEIFENLSIIENITLGQQKVPEKELIALLGKYGIEHILDKDCKGLSGGEKRIISLLRGLLSKSSVILMDEPTNDLDYKTVDTLVHLIDDFTGEKTFLCVTHDERLNEIASCFYEIQNHELKLKHSEADFTEQLVYHETNKISLSNHEMNKRIFSSDYCQTVLFIVIMMVTVYYFIGTLQSMNFSINRIQKNQIELCNTLYLSSDVLLSEGYLPTSIISYMKQDISDSELQNRIQKALQESAQELYSLSLELKQNDNYNVYAMDLYDVESCISYSVLDAYAENILGLDTEKYYIDTSEYFSLSNGEFEKKVPVKFKEEEYRMAVETILRENGNQLENTHIVIRLNDSMNFEQFVLEDDLSELWEGNYFIRSNETIYLVETARKLSECQAKIKEWAVISGIMAILFFANNILHIGLQKKKIQILANFGCEEKELLKAFTNRYCNSTRYKLVGILIALLFVALFFYYHRTFDVREMIIPILFAVFYFFNQFWQKKAGKHQIKNIFKIEGEL